MYAGSIIRKLAINSNFKKTASDRASWVNKTPEKKEPVIFIYLWKKNPWNIPSSLDNADENESSLWKARASEKKSLDLK